MLLQTNSYIVPRDKRNEHARLLRRFRQCLLRLGCDHFEVYEQVGSNWSSSDSTGRFVQIMRFRDRRHQLEVQAAERTDKTAQNLVREFCELINFAYQQQQGLFAVGYYTSFLRMPTARPRPAAEGDEPTPESIEAMQASLARVPEPGAAPAESIPPSVPGEANGSGDVQMTSLSNASFESAGEHQASDPLNPAPEPSAEEAEATSEGELSSETETSSETEASSETDSAAPAESREP